VQFKKLADHLVVVHDKNLGAHPVILAAAGAFGMRGNSDRMPMNRVSASGPSFQMF
jgi:hypothetical protein